MVYSRLTFISQRVSQDDRHIRVRSYEYLDIIGAKCHTIQPQSFSAGSLYHMIMLLFRQIFPRVEFIESCRMKL